MMTGVFMKRILFFAVIAALITGSIFAQESNQPNRNPRSRTEGRPQAGPAGEQRASEKITLTGTLGIRAGQIAVVSGGTSYFVPGLHRFIGFIDGLKDGATVTVEGYTFPQNKSEENQFLRITKLNLGGKDYDLSPLPGNGFPQFRNAPTPMHMMNPQHGNQFRNFSGPQCGPEGRSQRPDWNRQPRMMGPGMMRQDQNRRSGDPRL
jgi:hypothetical protein